MLVTQVSKSLIMEILKFESARIATLPQYLQNSKKVDVSKVDSCEVLRQECFE